MPRPRSSNWFVSPATVIAPSGNQTLTIDLVDTFFPQFLVSCMWASTSGTTGATISIARAYVTAVNATISGGMGLSAGTTGETLTIADHPDSVTIYVQPTAMSTNQVINPDFAVNPEVYPRYIQIIITNSDGTYPMTCTIVGDR